MPNLQQTARALPSIDAWRRSRPAMIMGSDGAAIHASTLFAAARAALLVLGTPSSTRETSRQ
jgi:hypothetical protein